MRLDNELLLAAGILLCIVLFICIVFVLGIIMRHGVRPFHDKLWKHKKRKSRDIKNLFLDGMFLLIMLFWFPVIIILTMGSLYIAVTGVIEKNIFTAIVGIALSTFFGAKLGYMIEHRIVAQKRWKRKKKRR